MAEQQLQFEHRDLHWGNILLLHTDLEHCTFRLGGHEHRLATHGVLIRIIDYTLSRIDCGDGEVFFCKLAKHDQLFNAGGDYQFDVYRIMRSRNNNIWHTYQPSTNILWLHYVCIKMISDTYYQSLETSEHLDALDQLSEIQRIILTCTSTYALVLKCNFL